MAQNANMVWDSLTNVAPPVRWYPSVGGAVLPGGKETAIDPVTKAKVSLIKSVRWSNIGLSRTPVNVSVPSVSVIGADVFAKCLTLDGHFDLAKALEAGTGTDMSALTGGAALAWQSLDPHVQATLPAYSDVREALARHVRANPGGSLSLASLTAEVVRVFGVPADPAESLVRKFLINLKSSRRNP